jgi:hypothetical protein
VIVRRWAGAVLVAVAVALVGCAETRTIETGGLAAADGAATSAPTTTAVAADPPVTTTEPPGTTPTTPPPQATTPTTPSPPPPPVPDPPPTAAPGGRHAAGWESFQVGADGRTLVFTYYAGVAPCSVFDSIDAVEGPAQVTVTIYERSDVGPDVACIAIAQQRSATVTLDYDLGGRTVVDGGR